MNDNTQRASGSCPAPALLRQLVAGKLSPDVEENVTQHVADCLLCQKVLEESVPSSFATAVRTTLSSADSVPESLSGIIQKAEADIAETIADRQTVVGRDTFGDRGTAKDSWADVQPWLAQTNESGIGQLGPYRLTELLGRGGMGIVFRSADVTLNRPVAVKVLSPSLLVDQTARERFLREAKAVAAISHPAIVGIYEVAHDAELPYFAMEFVAGQSLEEQLADGRKFGVNEVLRVAYYVATGLDAAHSANLIHRDIKPANILIETGTGRVRIMDFGLARSVADGSLTASGALLGTPSYMAPETIAEQPQDARTDLFSLGAVMYHMLTGRQPFQAKTVIGTIQAISGGRYEPVRNLVSDVPTSVENIIKKLLARDPADRYQTAAELAKALKNARRKPTKAHEDAQPRFSNVNAATAITAVSAVAIFAVFALLLKSALFPSTPTDTPAATATASVSPVPNAVFDNSATTAQGPAVADASVEPVAKPADTRDTFEEKDNVIEASPPSEENAGETVRETAERTEPRPKSMENVSEAGVVTKSPPAAAVMRIRCLDADGQLVTQAESLSDAAEAVPHRGVIQLGQGTFILTRPIDFEDKDVTISGSEERATTVIANFDGEFPVVDSSGSLTLRNLEFQDKRAEADAPEDSCVVALAEGRLKCSNCTFELRDGTAVWLDQPESAEFTHCRFYSFQGSAIQWAAEESGGRVLIDDCLIVGDMGIVAEVTLPEFLEISRCRTLNRNFLWFTCDEDVAIASDMIVSNSILLAAESILSFSTESDRQHSWEDFSWRGSSNLYTQPVMTRWTLNEDDDENEISGVADFREWTMLPFVTESRSRTYRLPADVEDLVEDGRESHDQIEEFFDTLPRVEDTR